MIGRWKFSVLGVLPLAPANPAANPQKSGTQRSQGAPSAMHQPLAERNQHFIHAWEPKRRAEVLQGQVDRTKSIGNRLALAFSKTKADQK